MKTIAYYLFLVIFLTSCNVSDPHNDIVENKVEANLEIENIKISNIKDISGIYTLFNDTGKDILFDFGSGCQFAINVYRKKAEIFNSQNNMGCIRQLTSIDLKKNERKSFELKFMRLFDVPLYEGTYTVKSFLIGYEKETSVIQEFLVPE